MPSTKLVAMVGKTSMLLVFFYTLRVRISLLTRPNREKEKVSFFIMAAHVITVYQNYTVCISVLRTSYLVLDVSSPNIYRVL